MDPRKLLCFDPMRSDDGVVAVLRARGWDVQTAHRLDEATNLLDNQVFHLGIVLIGAREHSDHSPVQSLLAMRYPMEWIALVPPQALQFRDVCQLIAQGFYDYHTFPLDVERLQFTLGHAYGMALIMKRLRTQSGAAGEEGLIGCSHRFIKMMSDIDKVAALDVTVLINGEANSGKELAARTIHRRSERAGRPFVVVSCDALSAELLQSELFGYEKGAFTGAHRSKSGVIESAADGTLYLDEVSALPLELQQLLLEFLRERTIRRVGGTMEIPVDVRVIASSTVDLKKAVGESLFSAELLRTLSAVTLNIPPLRERRDDIELLAKYYLDLSVNEKYRHISGFTPEAVVAMQRFDWPGNISELINRVRRAMVMCEDRYITPADLGLGTASATSTRFADTPMTLEQAKAEAEKEIIQVALRAADNNISRASRQLEVSRMTLYRLIEKHGIRADDAEGNDFRFN